MLDVVETRNQINMAINFSNILLEELCLNLTKTLMFVFEDRVKNSNFSWYCINVPEDTIKDIKKEYKLNVKQILNDIFNEIDVFTLLVYLNKDHPLNDTFTGKINEIILKAVTNNYRSFIISKLYEKEKKLLEPKEQ